MDMDDVLAMEAAMLKRLIPWQMKCGVAIRSQVADAEAHAIKSITDRLKAVQDGRATQRRLLQGPSWKAAAGHLDELETTLTGIIKDARESFYAGSIELWKPHVTAEYLVTPDPKPTVKGILMAREAVVGGYSLSMELSPAIHTAVRTLTVACSVAGTRTSTDRKSDQRIKLWSSQTVQSLIRTTDSILATSDAAIHEAAGWLIIDPKYRGERLVDPGAGLHF